MKIASLIARILLGLLFVFAGVFTFFLKSPMPVPGIAGEVNLALFQSHWILAVALAQAVAGILLLVNRYVPVALIILAAFLYNSFAFHVLTSPQGLPMFGIAFVLWFTAAWPYRAAFAMLFNAKSEYQIPVRGQA